MRDSEPGKIFIGGLNYITTDESLTGYFIRFGAIKDSVVMKEKDGKPRGFGFVTYADPAAAQQVLSSPPGAHVIDGKAVDVKNCVGRDSAPAPSGRGGRGGFADGGFGGRGRGAPRGRGGFGSDRGGGRGGFGGGIGRPAIVSNQFKIFVGGLPGGCTEQELRNSFQVFGPVRDAVVMIDQATQRSKGFGFVTFESDDAVERATNDQYMSIQNKKVEIKRATGGPGASGADSSRGGGRGGSRGGIGGGRGGGGYGGESSGARGYGGGYGGGDGRGYDQQPQWGQDSQPSYGQSSYDQQPPWGGQQQPQQQPWAGQSQPPPQQGSYGPPATDPYGSQYGTSGYGSFEAAAQQYNYPYPDSATSAAATGGPQGYPASGYATNGSQPGGGAPPQYGGSVSGYPAAAQPPSAASTVGSPYASSYGAVGNGSAAYGAPPSQYPSQVSSYGAPDVAVGGYGKTTLASSRGGAVGGRGRGGVDTGATRGRGGATAYHPYRR